MRRRAAGRRMAAAALLLLTALAIGCEERPRPSTSRPTRGYLLISLDTVGAVHLGCYGAERDTTPFLDSLAARGVLFENAFVQYPSTLVSHLSMFTGLYPKEHGVYPPAKVLSPRVPMLPELFQRAGFRTGGHTEGGFVAAHYGFDRGFDEFDDSVIEHDTDIEKTFRRGLDFLASLGDDEPFFLFLHTYSAHDPYEPPEEYRRLFAAGFEPAFDSSKENIARVNGGFLSLDDETREAFHALYDGGLRYVDDVLADLFSELDRMGVLDETTVVITSDHGEEFFEHGRLGHSQVYPETLRVPLIVLAPGLEGGRRVTEIVESIDIAPTLFELAGIEPPARLSGTSLTPLLAGETADADPSAYAEVAEEPRQRTLVARRDGRLLQVLTETRRGEDDGIWVTRRASFDVDGSERIQAVAFAEPRRLAVSIDGKPRPPVVVGTEWQPLDLGLAGSRRQRVEIAAAGCVAPRELGWSDDGRCLSFKLRGLDLRRSELFDLDADPLAAADLSLSQPQLFRRLAKRLADLDWLPVAPAEAKELSPETLEQLRALGYIQ